MRNLKKALERERSYLVELRRDFHRHPELGLCEFRTAKRIEEELERFRIPHRRVGETGVLGILRGDGLGTGTIVLRADIDALPIQETNPVEYCSQTPGIMHACGHDAHTACLLVAAKLLSERRADFGGEVRLVFQPAEEIGQGARPFVEAGVLDGADRVFGIHTASDLPSGTIGLKPGLNNAADHDPGKVRPCVHPAAGGRRSLYRQPHCGRTPIPGHAAYLAGGAGYHWRWKAGVRNRL